MLQRCSHRPRNNGTPSLKTFSCALCDVIADLAHKQQLGSGMYGVEGKAPTLNAKIVAENAIAGGLQIPKHGLSMDRLAESVQVKLVKASNLPREARAARVFVPMNDQSFRCNQPQNLFRFTEDLYMLKGSSDPLVEAAPKNHPTHPKTNAGRTWPHFQVVAYSDSGFCFRQRSTTKVRRAYTRGARATGTTVDMTQRFDR